jgi:hypothetical protein
MIVLIAAFTLLDRAVSGSTQVAGRQEAVQRGRVAMEQIAQRLRSEVCLGDAQPVLPGSTDDSVTFYANLSSNPSSAQKRTLRYVAGEKRLYEDVYNGSGTFPTLTFPASPTKGRELVHPIVQATKKSGSTTITLPIFRYYRYATGTATGALQQLATPLSVDDAPDVVTIGVAFAALPTRKVERTTDIKDATTFESDVYVRLADPTKPAEGPNCL